MASRATARFPIGTKQVFLPQFPISMLRPRGNQSPKFARFQVPLNWTKFDIRDYLLHVYNVSSVGVRAHVQQQPIKKHPVTKKLFRPLSTKEMIVELEKPFVWPAKFTEEEKKPWNPEILKKRHEKMIEAQKYQKIVQLSGFMPLRDYRKNKGDDNIQRTKEEAEKLLETGNWENHRPLDPKFQPKK